MNRIKNFIKGSIAGKLVFITILLSLIKWLISGTLYLTNCGSYFLLDTYLSLSGDWYSFITHPWTIFTYFWFHTSFIHLLINMIYLYILSREFINFFGYRQLISLYIMSSLIAGILYPLLFGILSLFDINYIHLPMYGSSASILSLVFAIVAYAPHYRVPLFRNKTIPFSLLSLFILLPIIFNLERSAFGEIIVHLGGIVIGLLFGYLLRIKGIDISKYVGKSIDFLVDKTENIIPYFSRFFTSNKKKKKYSDKKEKNSIDTILEKVKRSGYGVLTDEERRIFFNSKTTKKL